MPTYIFQKVTWNQNILHMNGSQHYKSHSDSEQSITEEISGDDSMSERDSDPISPEYVEHVVSGVVERWLDLHGENSSNCLVPNIWPSNRQKGKRFKKHLPDL